MGNYLRVPQEPQKCSIGVMFLYQTNYLLFFPPSWQLFSIKKIGRSWFRNQRLWDSITIFFSYLFYDTRPVCNCVKKITFLLCEMDKSQMDKSQMNTKRQNIHKLKCCLPAMNVVLGYKVFFFFKCM